MSKQQWIVVGLIAVVAVGAGLLIKNRNSGTDNTQSQLPAEQAEANYNVPPNIGASVDNTSRVGVGFPNGDFTYTAGQANALPSNGNGV